MLKTPFKETRITYAVRHALAQPEYYRPKSEDKD
jgi:hypothetical protein